MRALTPGAARDFVPASEKDKPAAEQGAFRIRVLKAAEFVVVMDHHARGEQLRAYVEAIGYGLVGWRNMTDEHGAPVPFPEGAGRSIDSIPAYLYRELGEAIIEGSRLAPEDRGK